MNIEELRTYCLQKPLTTECFPFDESTLVFKVGGKMFLLTDLNNAMSVNVKCDPEMAIELREKYSSVLPGYHMNKQHWNTVIIDGTVPDKIIYQWIDVSYDLVFKSLPKSVKSAIVK
jgi:predicted DNA-binding protein (MmcQ/YjbR family)